MARRYNCRRVKIHRNYAVEEIAKLLRVHKQTVLRWIATGLTLIEPKRPFLIHGTDLRAYLLARQPKKQPCKPSEIYCVRCREPREPAGRMAEYAPRSASYGRLSGICPSCDSMMYRSYKCAALGAIKDKLAITFKDADRRLVDTSVRSRNVAFGKDSSR